MSKEGFTRQEVARPVLPEDKKLMPDPGEIERVPQPKPPQWVWVVLVVIAVVALVVLLVRSGNRTLMGGGFSVMSVGGLSMLMMMRNRGGGGDRKNRPAAIDHRRAKYLLDLDELRDDLHADAAVQAHEIAYRHPDPATGSLTTLVGTGRMWECEPGKPGFGHVRIGVGMNTLKTELMPPLKVPPAEYRETVTAMAARDFLLTQPVVHDVAKAVDLFSQPGFAFFADAGQRATVQGVLRAMIAQLCTFHSPDVVRVAVVTDDAQAWEWCKWLPHTGDRDYIDACGPARLLFADVAGFVERFGPELAAVPAWSPQVQGAHRPEQWMVVVVDYPGASVGQILGGGGYAGVSVLEATDDESSVLATRATTYQFDEHGDLLKADDKEKH